MCRTTMEYNINTAINDFGRFIEFNESEKPILSAKQGVFGKKDSFKLNMLLENKKEVNAIFQFCRTENQFITIILNIRKTDKERVKLCLTSLFHIVKYWGKKNRIIFL